MRGLTSAGKIRELMRLLGRQAGGPGRVFLVGGATAVLIGWRDTTKDVDLKLDPEPRGVFEALRDAKEGLDVNIELAAPDDFVPSIAGWEDRSLFIEKQGPIAFYHYDPLGQALAKIERGHRQDLDDVRHMHRLGLIEAAGLEWALSDIEGRLLRYPALDPNALRRKVFAMVEELKASGKSVGYEPLEHDGGLGS